MTILKINLNFTHKISKTVKKVIIPIYATSKISMKTSFITKKKQHQMVLFFVLI